MSETKNGEDVGERIEGRLWMLELVKENQPAKSLNNLAESQTRYSKHPIKRVIRKWISWGIVTRDPQHPEANELGDGAIYLTDLGEQILEMKRETEKRGE